MSRDNPRIKVVFVGNSGVGKTSLINRKISGHFDYAVSPTVGSSHLTATEKVIGQTVELCLWDTAGQEKYQSLVPLYLRDAICIIIVASLIDHLSIQNIENWSSTVKDQVPDGVIFVVINKIDMKGEYVPAIEDLRSELGNKYENLFFVSARDGDFVNELFFTIAQKGLNSLFSELPTKNHDQTLPIKETKEQKSPSCC